MYNIKIGHLNAQSINNKIEEIKCYLGSNKFDVFSINETWLNSKKNFKLPNFNIFRRDRIIGSGGGVCICVNTNLVCTDIQTSDCNVEAVVVKISSIMPANKDLFIVSYYNPPDKKIDPEFLNHVKDIASNGKLIILGDLNAHNTIWFSKTTNSNGHIIENFLSDNEFVLMNNNQYTYFSHCRNDYHGILDLVIAPSTTSALISNFEVSDELCSDHNTVIFNLKIASKNHTKHTIRTIIDWEKFKVHILRNSNNLNDLPLDTTDQIDRFVENLTTTIQSSIKSASCTKFIKTNNHGYLALPSFFVD